MDFYKLNIFFTPIFYWCGFFYSNIILKLDFGYNIFDFEVIMFLFSNFFRYGSDVFYTKYYLKNSFFVNFVGGLVFVYVFCYVPCKTALKTSNSSVSILIREGMGVTQIWNGCANVKTTINHNIKNSVFPKFPCHQKISLS